MSRVDKLIEELEKIFCVEEQEPLKVKQKVIQEIVDEFREKLSSLQLEQLDELAREKLKRINVGDCFESKKYPGKYFRILKCWVEHEALWVNLERIIKVSHEDGIYYQLYLSSASMFEESDTTRVSREEYNKIRDEAIEFFEELQPSGRENDTN